MGHTENYYSLVAEIAEKLDADRIDKLAIALRSLRDSGGRLFMLGVGGSAANCSHAVNDFRKLCGIETYAPTDNVAELTARTNDEGWETVFSGWLKTSQITSSDAVLVFSVGGGNAEHNVSTNIIRALEVAKATGAKIFGVVGRDGGYTAQVGDIVVIVPTVDDSLITPLTEAYQAVVWHGLVSHPELQTTATKW